MKGGMEDDFLNLLKAAGIVVVGGVLVFSSGGFTLLGAPTVKGVAFYGLSSTIKKLAPLAAITILSSTCPNAVAYLTNITCDTISKILHSLANLAIEILNAIKEWLVTLLSMIAKVAIEVGSGVSDFISVVAMSFAALENNSTRGNKKAAPCQSASNTKNNKNQEQKKEERNHLSGGNFHFDPNKDRDFTNGKPTCKLDARGVIAQLVKAFKEARKLIENGLKQIDCKNRKFGHEYIPAKNWKVTRVDTILVRCGKTLKRMAFPVEMVAEVKVEISPTNYVEYTACINLDNPKMSFDGNGPHGPHVGYDFGRIGGEGPRGHTGHILLNYNHQLPDRHRNFSIDEMMMENHISDEPLELIDPMALLEGRFEGEEFRIERIDRYDGYDEDIKEFVSLEKRQEDYKNILDEFPNPKSFEGPEKK
ncbi:uncharacterized protein LOC132205857 [Neocloeon triangulifer]|uniref:uncharacterized protein LOC132205857 n=1 Tax=Neocloeon triangulifer TaxID=2078957 RepID=UPI00286F0C7C|nr:uncharacterized protein LOC132205857 [Neocloeon triangulifer]XP_059491189.1 uncharacterized protein LOC132205857 [Neocloeon triangulifer]XP_059491198.1 uncharacterized protein LOC132205857 [Neocloeon triangulifer]